MIIGIAGKKRSGKDLAASMIAELVPGTIDLKFAAPIKAITRELFGWGVGHTDGEWKEDPDPKWDGLTPRKVMQLLGTEVGRTIHPELWIRYALTKAHAELNRPAYPTPNHSSSILTWDLKKAPRIVTISDVRFENEARAIRSAGGFVIRLIRKETEESDTHASELDLEKECMINPQAPDSVIDQVIFNSSTKEWLRGALETTLARVVV